MPTNHGFLTQKDKIEYRNKWLNKGRKISKKLDTPLLGLVREYYEAVGVGSQGLTLNKDEHEYRRGDSEEYVIAKWDSGVLAFNYILLVVRADERHPGVRLEGEGVSYEFEDILQKTTGLKFSSILDFYKKKRYVIQDGPIIWSDKDDMICPKCNGLIKSKETYYYCSADGCSLYFCSNCLKKTGLLFKKKFCPFCNDDYVSSTIKS